MDIQYDFSGQTAIVTGGARGIGRAIAVQLMRFGAQVWIWDVDPVELDGAHSLTVDVTKANEIAKAVAQMIRQSPRIDILINNAGIGATGHFVEAAPQRLRKIMEVNFFGVTETVRVFLPLLRAGNRPAIVNISSIAGKRAIPARSEYSASKFAVHGFSEALRAELAKDGIDVLIICPGLTDTNFSKNMLEQKARMPVDHLRGMKPQKVAAATLRAIEHGRHEVCLTVQGKLLVFVSRFFPRLADRIAARRVRQLFWDELQAGRTRNDKRFPDNAKPQAANLTKQRVSQ